MEGGKKRWGPNRKLLRCYSFEVAGNTIPPLRSLYIGSQSSVLVIMAKNSTVRRFCWTLNNYTEEDVDVLQKDLTELCKFAIFGRETCPSTGTKHLQGFW